MNAEDFRELIQNIVAQAKQLSDKHTDEHQAPVNYACVFTQSESEYEALINLVKLSGRVVKKTAMGPVYQIAPIETAAGKLSIVKIRRPDPKRPERGYADFTVSDYEKFKKLYMGRPGFSIIERPEMEMLELSDPAFNAIAYYSHPTLAETLGLKV